MAVGAYVLAAVAVALLIHFVVLGSPKFNWIFPVNSGVSSGASVNPPAPGAR